MKSHSGKLRFLSDFSFPFAFHLSFVSHAQKNDQAPFILHHSISPVHPSSLPPLLLTGADSHRISSTLQSLPALSLHSLLTASK